MKRKPEPTPSPEFVRNIESVLATATPADHAEGLAWYEDAHKFARRLALKHGVTVRQAAGIVSALSPGISWDVNKTAAEALFKTNRPHGPYKKNVAKARAIRKGADPGDVLGRSLRKGHKTRAFFACIFEPTTTQAVCVDRHAYDVAQGKYADDKERARDLGRVGVYETIALSYVVVAQRVGLLPSQVQAVTWVAWRNAKKPR